MSNPRPTQRKCWVFFILFFQFTPYRLQKQSIPNMLYRPHKHYYPAPYIKRINKVINNGGIFFKTMV